MKNKKAIRTLVFFGITFYEIDYYKIIEILKKSKGYLVAPAASALSQIKNKKFFHISLKKSRIAILDSGFFCVCLILLKGIYFKKFSGFKFIKFFLQDNNVKKDKILSLDSSKQVSIINFNYLKKRGFRFIKNYICPIYDPEKIYDYSLLRTINKYRPKFIIINLSGTTQEPLALFIIKNLKYKPIIICTGAALSFFTGAQAPINSFIDNFYLGLLIRIIFDPMKNFPRFFQSINLFSLVIKSKIKVKSIIV
jgi:N-acetylglucosaminyldiphosphoundecaprenol N-acetyl-beta-D-mannosaminyltransferase